MYPKFSLSDLVQTNKTCKQYETRSPQSNHVFSWSTNGEFAIVIMAEYCDKICHDNDCGVHSPMHAYLYLNRKKRHRPQIKIESEGLGVD